MVICSYFLKGNCRFGDNCKNEHSYNENPSSVLLKKPDIDINVLTRSVAGDMLKAEKGNQWPLSCYGPFQFKPCFPGFEDKCFEEIRLGFYEAQQNGTAEQYKQQLAQLLQEIRMKMQALQNPSPEATNMLKDIYCSNQNMFSNTPVQQNSIFGNNAGTHTNSIFGNMMQSNTPLQQTTATNFSFTVPENKSIFGNTQTPTYPTNPAFNNQNIFATAAANTNSIFGGAVPQTQTFGAKPIFQNPIMTPQNASSHTQSIFGNPPPTSVPQSTFAASPFNTQNNPIFASPLANTPNANPFHSPTNTTNANPFQHVPINSNITTAPNPIFSQNPSQSHSASIFANKVSQSNVSSSNKTNDPTIYSKMNELSSCDLEEYQKPCFEFGKIPTKAPPLEMC